MAVAAMIAQIVSILFQEATLRKLKSARRTTLKIERERERQVEKENFEMWPLILALS